jgi:undecaprenyl-diphosphatase
MDVIIVIIASYFIAIPLTVVIYQLFTISSKQLRYKLMTILVVTGVISIILAKLGSMIINDPRPFMAGNFNPKIISSTDNGFPSDHTLLAASIAWAMRVVSKKLSYVLLGVALLVGLARMAAGVHHSWDVLGSFVITLIAYSIAVQVAEFYKKHRAVKA